MEVNNSCTLIHCLSVVFAGTPITLSMTASSPAMSLPFSLTNTFTVVEPSLSVVVSASSPSDMNVQFAVSLVHDLDSSAAATSILMTETYSGTVLVYTLSQVHF
jgi:hypothetical protein